jgi:murein DD-endopeptidase MepM/ murein hydrolase activator NlpD
MMKRIDRSHEDRTQARTMRALWLAFFVLCAFIYAFPAQGEPLLWPLKDTGGIQYKSSGYGIRARPMGGSNAGFHYGIDLACRVGTPVVAVADAVVIVCAIKDSILGNYMVIRLSDGRDITYGHLKEAWYKRGQRVERGWIIGLSGNSGYSTGPHLHFSVTMDPMPMFKDEREWIGRH